MDSRDRFTSATLRERDRQNGIVIDHEEKMFLIVGGTLSFAHTCAGYLRDGSWKTHEFRDWRPIEEVA